MKEKDHNQGSAAVGWAGRLALVEPGEGRAVVLSAAYSFFLLFGYSLLRPIRDAIGIKGDLDVLPWLWTATTAGMVLAAPVFSWLASTWPRRVFIPWTYRFFALNVVVFWAVFAALPQDKEVWAGYAFYVWLSVFNLFAVSVFWGFMADVWTTAQSKRVFGAIAVGGTLGAIGGSGVQSLASEFGALHLMLLSAALLEAAVWCVKALVRHFGLDAPPAEPAPVAACSGCGYALSGLPASDGKVKCPECGNVVDAGLVRERVPRRNEEPTGAVWRGFVLIARSPYLQGIAVYMLLFSMTSTFLYFEQAKIVKAAYATGAEQRAAFATIDLAVNIALLFLQVFVTGRFIRKAGITTALCLVPVITGVGFLILRSSPTFAVLVTFYIARRAMHFAVDRPTREILYTVLGPDEKYKSKSFIDTFVYRGGDLLGAWAPSWLAKIGVTALAAGAAASALWAGMGVFLGSRHKVEAQRAGEGG